MKRFLISFAGTVAGIWFSILLFCIAGFVLLIVMFAGMGSSASKSVRKHSVLYIDLSAPISEYRQNVNLMTRLQGEDPSVVLTDLTDAIDAAADDDRIEGIFLECNGSTAGLAQRRAIIDALNRFRKSGKWVYAYGDTYTQADYYVAAAGADSLFVNPSGTIDIHGLAATTVFYKGLLDKLGVEMQVVKVGTYKSAVEPFILTSPSEASVEQQRLFLDNIWKTVTSEIAKARKVPADSVNAWAESLIMTADAKTYVKRRMADATAYRHAFIERLEDLTDEDDIRLVTPAELLAAGAFKEKKGNATIAVLYAEGDITEDGDGGIASSRLVPEILDLADDDDIDGLILRVNSGGGSAFASEQIWEALQQYKAMTGNPFYVSMSDYAASGGYYISCGADKIYAEPLTLTGSIGIFGLIPSARGLLTNKLGLTTSTVSTNPGGFPPTIFEPMTEKQRTSMQSYVERGYELFVSRVAAGRHMKPEQVKLIAEGRVWDGTEALKNKLVDKLGGLEAALKDMAAQLNVETYTVERYPEVPDKLLDIVMKMSTDVESSALERALGEDMKLYEALRSLRSMSPVQARMQNIEIR